MVLTKIVDPVITGDYWERFIRFCDLKWLLNYDSHMPREALVKFIFKFASSPYPENKGVTVAVTSTVTAAMLFNDG